MNNKNNILIKLTNYWRTGKRGKLVILILAAVLLSTCCCIATLIWGDQISKDPAYQATATARAAITQTHLAIPTLTKTPVPSKTPQPSPTSTPTKSAQEYFDEYDGNIEVYERILAMTNCADLQSEFNIASINNARETPGTWQFKYTLGYMTAIDEHMRAIGCYDD